MKTGLSSRSRHERRRRAAAWTPLAAELLEQRSLLTAGPNVLTPVGTVDVADPTISWDAIDGAVSYDLWVSDMDSRTVLFVEEGIVGNSYVPVDGLNQGRIRAWVRAKFADDSYSDWGPKHDFIVTVVPTVTGPINSQLPGTPFKIDDTTPVITWDSAPGSHHFEIFLSNQTALTSTQWTVQNLTAILDDNGDPIPDGKGDVLRQEIREFEIPDTLSLAQFQAFVRSFDDGGRVSDWSPAFAFEVAPKTQILRPTAPSFQNPPLLEWAAVPGATHYDVWVDGPGKPQLYRERYNVGTSYQIPFKLAPGDYTFWVQAINMTSGRPLVRGIWSDAALFGTLRRPVINGPVGVDTSDPTRVIVTDAHPTITWTPIDKAVRYEVWVDRTQGPAEYVLANSSVSSYTFASIIDPGNYWAWVRAFSSTGVATAWSLPYVFTATGGAPVITSPTDNDVTVALPTFTWSPVAEAESYEVWVALVGVDFDYIRVSGITEESFTPLNPLNAGTYRLWVRAIGVDGTAYRWSDDVTFVVAAAETPASSESELLASATQPLLTSRIRAETDARASRIPQADPESEHEPPVEESGMEAITPAAVRTADDMSAELISRIAADGVLTEWWTAAESL